MNTNIMTRDQARDKFKNAGLSYSDIKIDQIILLTDYIHIELSEFEHTEFKMYLKRILKKNLKFSKDGALLSASLRVKSSYFDDRPGITFNQREEFIGFAGWADDKNIQPILTAFCKWVDKIKAM